MGRLVSRELPPLLALLASEVRRSILIRLATGAKDCGTVAFELNMSGSAVRYHVRRLRKSGLVSVRRKGRRHLYRLGRHATIILGRKKAILNVSAPDGSQATVSVRLDEP